MATIETFAKPKAPSGTAAIKPEFIFHADDKNGDIENKNDGTSVPNTDGNDANNEPAAKRPKWEKKARGVNKGRYYHNKANISGEKSMCHKFVDIREGAEWPKECPCSFSHDVSGYLSAKPPDIGDECYAFKTFGYCRRGVTCRFGSQHLTPDGRNKIAENYKDQITTDRVLLYSDLQLTLRKREFNFDKANKIVDVVSKAYDKWITAVKADRSKNAMQDSGTVDDVAKTVDNIEEAVNHEVEAEPEAAEGKADGKEQAPIDIADEKEVNVSEPTDGESSCIFDKPNHREKKTIDWRGKLYLAPLTTLGNLPFRRVCKEWGADVTCGEMAMATSILKGFPQEWALLRRHESEDLFGVQICGSNANVLTRCSQLIEEAADVDFIDLNLGCPIELVYKSGGGSGLLRRGKQLSIAVNSMAQLCSVPITVKTRTGIYQGKNVAHTHMPLYEKAGVSLVVVHGRSREQRYTRTADWDYIEDCAVRAAPTPVFGNGDVLSFKDYNHVMSSYPHVAGVMIGRGALYKPWIFTEIKEQRDWDISSSERLDILRKFSNYGLEHWGSDTRGVENTRRFLLEWLSFLYRYIPLGLLECPPQRINERPPRYIGRNDLETLMASPNCADWIKISEMLLGPVPEGFQFLPKHKASSWANA